MVHISDGILTPQVWITGFIITMIILTFTLRKLKTEDVPLVSLITAAVFVASLIHIPAGPTSVHLILNGLAGVILGFGAFPSIFVALLLQAALFQHGGLTTLGINALTMGIPALVASAVFRFGTSHMRSKKAVFTFAAIAGGLAVYLAVLLTSIALFTTGTEFLGVIGFIAVAHIPVGIIEAIVIGNIAVFLLKVKPEMLKEVGK